MIGKIISYQMLNHDVVEIIFQLPEVLNYKPGQWALIDYKDAEQPLKRAYSIAEYKVVAQGCQITLAIKMLEGSKSGGYLRQAKEGDEFEIVGIFGHFVLQENNNPKVFVGTGTGLVPLIAMANETKSQKKLYFSVSYKSDLFYVDRIKNIENLESHIHISREEVEGCEPGRIDLSKESFPDNAEFYLCGNPTVVNSLVETIESKGYKNIYTEKY
ncbi:MAG: FAD-dependent oxidoreductase [Candidatus Absconditabacteria bacterium]|nr:FAD-dependent oxidoreductase [Candidatus Absconditabacteria bacterium]